MTAEGTDFLYPFIEAAEHDVPKLLDDLVASAEAKAAKCRQLRASTLAERASEIETASQQMARRFERGGRLFTAGNGGSSTDATSMAALFSCPPSGRALPARSLVADEAILTAVGNDVGFELVFSRQLIAYATEVDILIGFSTSGNSENLVRGFEQAKRKGLLTVGIAGYEGGRMAECGDIDHFLLVRSDSVHRVQETQEAVGLALWRAVQDRLRATGTSGAPGTTCTTGTTGTTVTTDATAGSPAPDATTPTGWR